MPRSPSTAGRKTPHFTADFEIQITFSSPTVITNRNLSILLKFASLPNRPSTLPAHRRFSRMAPSIATNGAAASKDVELYINGISRSSSTNSTFPVHNPLTGKFLYNAHSASADDCRAAVDAAEAAFKEWKEWPPSRRRMLFYKAADLYETPEWQAKIKERMSSETGANSNWIHPANTVGAAAHLREVGSVATHIKGEVIPSDFPGSNFYLWRLKDRDNGHVDSGPSWSGICHIALECTYYAFVACHCHSTDLWKHSYSEGIRVLSAHSADRRRSI